MHVEKENHSNPYSLHSCQLTTIPNGEVWKKNQQMVEVERRKAAAAATPWISKAKSVSLFMRIIVANDDDENSDNDSANRWHHL